MSTMIIYFCFLLPLLLHSIESSSIRGRNSNNELVPLMSSRVEPQEKDNSLKIVSNEPFVIQLPLPNVNETKEAKDGDKKTKQTNKKRVSKRKPLRKKNRTKRDLRLKPIRDLKNIKNVKSSPLIGNSTKNINKNVVSRKDVLKALSSYPKRKESKKNEPEGYLKDARSDNHKVKHGNGPDRKHRPTGKGPLIKMVYPNTPKPERNPHRYTYKDLMADRKRIEQKINYIKNMFNVNDPTADETIRKRRRTETDRTANKIAKMFLTLSAVNGMQDRRRPRCRHNENDDDRVQDVWEKERRDSPSRKSTSSNEERYKVKKWIEFMKNKRSSGKTCPCMTNFNGDERDAFPLEQKLPKGYYLLERRGSSEESLETYRDPFYNSRDSPLTSRNRSGKDQDKDQSKNGKKKIELPFTDLELYRSRAKQILQNAEEILDRIKEEEEKRLSSPLMSQLKELTSRIHGDPRNNENDLIRKIQKNLGWNPLAKSNENTENGNSFVDNVKSYILDPYEKAKALTDESAKMLSSYLLRNLGKMQESSEEQEIRNTGDETDVLQEKERPLARQQVDPLSKNKEELQQWEDTISTILNGAEENLQKEVDSAKKKEEIKTRMEDIIKEQQKKLNDYEVTHDAEGNSQEIDSIDDQNLKQTMKETDGQKSTDETPHEGQKLKEILTVDLNSQKKAEDETVAEKEQNDLVEKAKSSKESILKEKNDPESKETKEEKELEKEIFDEIIKTVNKAEENVKEPKMQDSELEEKLENVAENLEKEKLGLESLIKQQETTEHKTPIEETNNRKPSVKDRDETDVLSSPHLADQYDMLNLGNDYGIEDDENLEETSKFNSDDDMREFKSNEETLLEELLFGNGSKEKGRESENGSKEADLTQEIEGDTNVKESLKDPIVHGQQDKNIYTEVQETQKPLNHGDLVKETSKTSSELLETESPSQIDSKPIDESKEDLILEKMKSNEDLVEEKRELEEDNLQSENQRKNSEEIEQEADDTTSLKEPQDSEEILEESKNNDEEELDGKEFLEAVLENMESAKEAQPDEKTSQVDRSSETETEDDIPLQAINTEDDTPLQAVNPEKNTEDEKLEISENFKDEAPLKASLENKSQETELENDDETPLKVSLENRSQEHEQENDDETLLKAENPTEESENQSLGKKEINKEEANSDEEVETPLREVLNSQTDQEYVDATAENVEETSKEGNLEDEAQGAGKSEEHVDNTPLQATLNKDENLENVDETVVEATNPNQDANNNDKETQYKESSDPNNEEATILKSSNPEDNSNDQPENYTKKEAEEVGSDETNPDVTVGEPHQKISEASDRPLLLYQAENSDTETKAENPEERSQETPLRSTFDTQEDMEDEEQDDVSLMKANSEEEMQSMENSQEKSGEALRQAFGSLEIDESSLQAVDPEETNTETQNSGATSKEILKAALDNEGHENYDDKTSKTDEQSNRQEVDETPLQSTLKNHNEENSKEIPEASLKTSNKNLEKKYDDLESDESIESFEAKLEDQETNGSNDTPLQATQDNQDYESMEEMNEGDIYIKEANPSEKSENLEDETAVGAVLDPKNKENRNDKENLETGAQVNTNTNEDDEAPLRASLGGSDPVNQGETDKLMTSQDSSFDEKSASLEFDNKIDETSLKSPNPEQLTDPESIQDSEETLREEDISEEFNNQIDDDIFKNLKSAHFFGPDSGESEEKLNSFETLRQETPLGENLVAEDNPDLRQATSHEGSDLLSSFPELLQKPDSQKAAKLKVPKSIGQIMKDLNGKENNDITSIGNLNPEKIDHIIGKIGEAEQQNLVDGQEVDCRKECACADEIDTRSRNIGRYEIAKDFLHWMKDLQLNRVLSDD